MADENPQAQGAEGGGKGRSSSMYDPARDSWEAQQSSAITPTQPQPAQSISTLDNPPAQESFPSVLGGPSPTTQSAVRNTTSAHQEQIPRDPPPPSIEFEKTGQKPSQFSDAYTSPRNAKMSSPQAASPAPESTEAHNGALASPTAVQEEPRPGYSKRRRLQERHQQLRKRGRTPPSAYARRDMNETAQQPNRNESSNRSPSPLAPPRSPSPDAQARKRKRPGGGARMGLVDRETLRRRQEERERSQQEEAMRFSQNRGVTDIVRHHYNAVPQRGREWRKTESKIKGLRSFNNWIKSTLIQKFSPDEEFVARSIGTKDWADETAPPPMEDKRLLVVDLGCGKGGDLGKWQLAPQPVDLYVGLDPAEVSIVQARERYNGMRTGRGPRGRRGPLFHAEFAPKDCFGEYLGDVPIVQQVGIDPNAGPGGSVMSSRWGGGGFDVVASMFTIHYAFESEEKARQMLRNVAGCLKKGGRFLGVCPNSDIISARVAEMNAKRKERETAAKKEEAEPEDGEVEEDDNKIEWGNSIYRVRFSGDTPEDGIFRPPFGWKYSYFMEEAVEEIPEYVVPWEAFRALTEDYNLELQYRKPFLEVWEDEKDDQELGPLSERMGVRDRNTGALLMTEEEKEAASFYHAFCFYKV
ncbi:mRNA capping enzyme [Aspergillus parasiticus SU-1]|uniref:mRNA cap guanine-N(7) methyltransferase n=1 Tax=Aspergillus parasiticus (strain ATCC 56775 / NRRL 5862 / SRRC 143 / SU-1) TaxID=1403190 RepID=A0A0F0IA17_ASPPU|nr:mRNA capping enzyme [Aspergillus parasiticus SU-1]